MRVLFIHDRLGAMAGAEVNAHVTAVELKNRGHVIGLLHGPPTGKSESAWRSTVSECHPLKNGSSAASVQRAIRLFAPDAVYIHKMSDVEVLESLIQSCLPVVRMVHDHDLYCLRSYKYFPLTRTICKQAAGLQCIFPCGGVLARSRGNGAPFKWRSYGAKMRELHLNRQFQRMIVATHFMKQELLRNGFRADRIEIHAPVPQTSDLPSPSVFSDRNQIVYAGQIIRGKGVDVLLESLARVHVPFECVILGDGNHRTHCEKLSRKLGLAEKVHFKGYVPPEELGRFYSEACLAVVSSVWPEPFGAVGLEAMRYGLPVVAFDAGGIREWLLDGRNGYLVPWMDRALYAQRVAELLRDKSLARKLGEQGRQLVREKWSFDRYISGLEKMFACVIDEARIRTTLQT